jgi:hypothetical protein
VTEAPFLLYHWAPASRRKGITHSGLVPGMWSSDRLWRPPYVCLAHSPSLAWGLSGGTFRGKQVKWWDLWMVWSSDLPGYEIVPYDNGDPKEYRVYERIYKRFIWYVGSRASDPRDQPLDPMALTD